MASNERLITPVLVNRPTQSTGSKSVLVSKVTTSSKPTIVRSAPVAEPIKSAVTVTETNKISGNTDSSNFIDEASYQAYLAAQLAVLINNTTINILSIFGNLTISDVGSLYNNSVVNANTIIIKKSLNQIKSSLITNITNDIYNGSVINKSNLYNFLHLLFPSVKSNTNLMISDLLSNTQIQQNIIGNTDYINNVLFINGNIISNIVSNINTYKYISAAEYIYINGNINNDNLFGMLDLLYPYVKPNVNSNVISVITNYSGNLLTPYYSPLISNIDTTALNNIVANLSIYQYMKYSSELYINGNIINDRLYNMMNLLYPIVKSNIDNTLLSTINNYNANLLTPYYSPIVANIDIARLSNLSNNVSIYNYMINSSNVYINGNISNDGLYTAMDLLYPSVKSNINTSLLSTITNYTGNLLIPYYSTLVANIDSISLRNVLSNVSAYTYMQKHANLYINGNISNDGLYSMMDLLYPTVKSNIDNNLLSTITNYTGNLLTPYYSQVVANIDSITLSNVLSNISFYSYAQKYANIYINGNISNDGLYSVMDLLYPSVKSNINTSLLSTINNYNANLLTPYYSTFIANIDSITLNTVLANVSAYTYMQKYANLYINGNISNDGLYSMMDLLYPIVKSNIDNNLLSTITNYTGNLLTPYYSPMVANINSITLSNVLANVSIYNYMINSSTVYINGNISNDGLYTMMDLLYPSVKSNINKLLLSTIINYTGNVLSPYYSPIIGNIDSLTLSNVLSNVSFYTYTQKHANLYINGNISNDGLYTMMDFLYPSVKSNIDTSLLSTIINYTGNILSPYYSPFGANMNTAELNNVSVNVSIYNYIHKYANVYINGNISNDGLYIMMDLLYPGVKSTIDSLLVSDIIAYSDTLLSPIYSPFISNINTNIIENLVSNLSLYTYINNYANVNINGNINNDGLYNMINFIFDINTVTSTIKNYSGNLLTPYYSSSAENINISVISNLVANIGLNNYLRNKENLYINGNINNDGLYNIMNLLYPNVKANVDNNLVSTIINYTGNLLSPHYSPFVANINTAELNSVSANVSLYKYMKNNSNVYINGNISNDGLYIMMDLLYPDIKSTIDSLLVSDIIAYSGTLLSPIYSPFISNINTNIIENLVSNLSIYTYINNYANVNINGNINNDGLYNMMNFIFDINTVTSTIKNYSGNLLTPYYASSAENINIGVISNLVANIGLNNYLRNKVNLYINGNISNDGLYNIMNLLYPNVKATVDNNLVSTILNYSGNLLMPYYSPFVANIDYSIISNLSVNLNHYNYMQNNANLYINGNISNDGLYNIMNLLYPNVKANVDNNLVSIIRNYSENVLSPYYSPVVANIDASILSGISANLNHYNYMQNNSNLYINGNISNNSLYTMMNQLYPNVKVDVDNTLLAAILNYRGNLLMPYYSPLVVNIDYSIISNISANLNHYNYMQNNANLYINGNISNDGLYNIMNLFYPNEKTTVDTYMLLTIKRYANTLLSPVYTPHVDNINIEKLNELVSKVSLYKYMNASTNIYINGGISNDGLYASMNLLFPEVKSTMDNELLLTLKPTNSNIISNIYSNLIVNIDDISLNNLISNVSLYNYINYNYNLNINGTIDVDKLNNILNLLYFNTNVNKNFRTVSRQFKYNK